MNRFVVIVLDSFGIGHMEDDAVVRPQNVGANTCKHILEKMPNLILPNLGKLGLMNALGEEIGCMKKSIDAVYGKAALMHVGADTFLGHQEIMGTKPKPPLIEPFSKSIDKVYNALKEAGYKVEYLGKNTKILLVNGCVTVGDNIEADLGQVYNLTSTLDLITYEEVIKIGKVVRNNVKVSRVIAFGGKNVSVKNILDAVEEKDGKYVGVNAPKSGVYNEGYQVMHMGYGVNSKVQAPTILGKKGVFVSLLGKVADIVANDYGKSTSCIDTKEVMELTIKEIQNTKSGFICTNVQETDLAGHEQNTEKYAEKLTIADKYIGRIMEILDGNDRLVVMADHGNDPTIGHSHHTREYVPILLYGKDLKANYLGQRKTLSDVGATVVKYFNCENTENGQSFL
ncbi:phosphopentomutase [Clostridium psychrophilum]|uniref:phosphopentomutase n=1 Tax=Clostridium psychrophilum TaxID=132926 RepID=UPI001C0BD8E8|nr:phosphopentomutase [Clostridium psychrophilum]MBU3182191.1 phosphopentomutase [Clostridium psychrophilum]